jgi:hypothetical protein
MAFNAGHRIRVSVAGSNAPRFELNPNHGGDIGGSDTPVVARPELLFGSAYPSRIELPVPYPGVRRGGRRRAPTTSESARAPVDDRGIAGDLVEDRQALDASEDVERLHPVLRKMLAGAFPE